jgi:hypothetical protein
MGARARAIGISLAKWMGAGALVAAGWSSASCQETPLPGTQLGTFKVTGTTTTNSCGAALGAPDPWVFDAQLSESSNLIYWSFMDGNSPLSGALTGTSASISATTSANVDPSDAGSGPCTLNREDAIDLTLGAASAPSSFTGTISYTFTVPSGSSCSDQLASAGGQYATLPCTLAYTISAQRQ